MNRLAWFRPIAVGLLIFSVACSSTPPKQSSETPTGDLRPDYQFVSIHTTELTGQRVYTVKITNTGHSHIYKREDPPQLTVEATAFYLFSNNRIRYVTQTTKVPNIKSGTSHSTAFQFNKTMRLKQPDGRRETAIGTWVMMHIDPVNAVFERNEHNNIAIKK